MVIAVVVGGGREWKRRKGKQFFPPGVGGGIKNVQPGLQRYMAGAQTLALSGHTDQTSIYGFWFCFLTSLLFLSPSPTSGSPALFAHTEG